jgi:hypothetical protein
MLIFVRPYPPPKLEESQWPLPAEIGSTRQRAWIPRRYVPDSVWKSTALTRPSAPGNTLTTRPVFHSERGRFLSISIQKSPTWKFLSFPCHLFRLAIDCRYNPFQISQKRFTSLWTCRYKWRGSSSSSSTAGLSAEEGRARKSAGQIGRKSCGSALA